MGKKKITRLSSPGQPIATPAQTTNLQQHEPLFDQKDTLHKMLFSANHTHRIDALNTISSLLKGSNAASITRNGLFQRIVELMADKMINVALAAASVIRHVTQVCDGGLLSYFIANSLHTTCYTLLQHLQPLYKQYFTQQVTLTKGHGLYWYNPNYLTMVRLLCHIVKILSTLFEVNDALVASFMDYIKLVDGEAAQQPTQQPAQPQQQDATVVVAPKVNFILFFFDLLTINISTIQPTIIPTIHLPFITHLQLDIYHCLRVLTHENGAVVNYFLSNDNILQFLIQQPLNYLQQQKHTTTTMQYSADDTTVQCSSDSIYTYQYCQSIVLANLYSEYTKVATNSKKVSALATTFHIYSNPRTNIELAMNTVVIIANILQHINLPKNKITLTSEQTATVDAMYTSTMAVVEYNIKNINLLQELSIYTSSLTLIHTILQQLSVNDLSLLQQYNLSTATTMSEAAVKLAHDDKQHQQSIRTQFKMLNVNNNIEVNQQQLLLVNSLSQLNNQRDAQADSQTAELDGMSSAMDGAPEGVAQDEDDGAANMTAMQPPPGANAVLKQEHDGDFPLQQLWNDAIYIHNLILQQYFNSKTLLADVFTMLFSDYITEYNVDNHVEDVNDKKEVAAYTQKLTKNFAQIPQYNLFHKHFAKLLTLDVVMPLLNHSYAHINYNSTQSYYPQKLVENVLTSYASCQNTSLETLQHIATLSYQNTMLRINSLGNFLSLLQFNNILSYVDQSVAENNIFTLHASTIHNILLTITTSTPLAHTPQQQQNRTKGLVTLEQQWSHASNLDQIVDTTNTPSRQQQQQQQGTTLATIDPAGCLKDVFSTTIDEANCLIQALSTFISNPTLIQKNQTLWKHPLLLSTQQQFAGLKDKIYTTENLTQEQINAIVAALPQAEQHQAIFVSQQHATSIYNFLSYLITAQQAYQSITSTQHVSAMAQEKLQKDSPHVEFQFYVIDYITTMATQYPLFGPVMTTEAIPQLITQLTQQFTTMKSSQFNCELLFAIINMIIDLYSEDDRFVLSYTNAKITLALSGLLKIHNEYLSWLKQSKLQLKSGPKAATGAKKAATTTTGASKTDTTMRAQQLARINHQYELTSEANQNLNGFVQYKKGLKL